MSKKLVWIGFGGFLLAAMSSVFMYYDDFGYASLSFKFSQPNVTGQDFTLSQWRSYLGWIYQNWSGRVIFPGLKILMLKEIWIYRAVQSAAVLAGFYALRRLSADTRPGTASALFAVSLYGAFSFEMFRSGFYWFSASATYVLPLAFFFAGCLIIKRIDRGLPAGPARVALGSVCFFLTGASQEQTAMMSAVLLVLYCVFTRLQTRTVPPALYTFVTASLLGSAFLFLAPGNFKRLEDHEPVSLARKVLYNSLDMARHYLNLRRNMLFLCLFACFVCAAGYFLWKAGRVRKGLYTALFPATAVFLLLPFLFNTEGWGLYHFNTVLQGIFYLYMGFAHYFIVKYLLLIKDRLLAALFFGALFSQLAMLVYSPYVTPRMGIVFYFALFALFIRVFTEVQAALPKRTVLVCVLLPVVVLSSLNLAYITRGYMLNKPANIHNDRLMRQISLEIKAGADIGSIELTPMPNGIFAADFPYWMPPWYREFYDLPGRVEIHYPPYW